MRAPRANENRNGMSAATGQGPPLLVVVPGVGVFIGFDGPSGLAAWVRCRSGLICRPGIGGKSPPWKLMKRLLQGG